MVLARKIAFVDQTSSTIHIAAPTEHVLTYGRLPPARHYYKIHQEYDAQRACYDVCDICQRAIDTDERDAAFWVDAHRSSLGISRRVGEDRWRMMLKLIRKVADQYENSTRPYSLGLLTDLTVEEIAPWVTGRILAEGSKVPEASHHCAGRYGSTARMSCVNAGVSLRGRSRS